MKKNNSFSPYKYLGALIIMSFSLTGWSQNQQLQFRHLTPDDGLSSSEVACIQQDSEGFIWIGTYNGLNRYDGNQFVIYKNIPGDSTSLLDNCNKSIFEDKNHNLFISSFKGLSLYKRDLDCFYNFRYDPKSALYNYYQPVFHITGDSISVLWIATSEGLIHFDYINNTAQIFKHDHSNPNSLCENFIEGVYLDSKKRLWLATHAGLDMLDNDKGIFKHIDYCSQHNKSIAFTYFNKIIEDQGRNLWFGSNDGLFFLKDGNLSESYELTHYQNNPENDNSLSNNSVILLFTDKKNNLWVGTENGGINIFNLHDQTFSHILIDPFNPNSLNNQSIYSIIEDRNNNLWVGTFGGGINLSVKNSNFIRRFSYMPGAPEGLSHNIIKQFSEDASGKIWVATDGGGLNLLDPKTGKFKCFNTQNSDLPTDAVLSIEEGDNNTLWIGTWAGGLLNFNKITHTFKIYNTQNCKISDNKIHSIAKDSKGNLWMGTQIGGLVFFDVKNGTFSNYWAETSDLKSNRVSVVKIDQFGKIYLGSTNNLQILDPATNKFESYEYDANNPRSISNNSVFDILIQNDTCVWIATGNGLNRFNPKTKQFVRYFRSNGLADDITCALTFDHEGILWITTNSGLSRFDYKSNTFRNFTKWDGLQGNEFSQKSILCLNNGNILAGGKNGFNLITPSLITHNDIEPKVFLTDLLIANQKVKPGIAGSPIKKQITECDAITLNYKQSVITLKFAALDYTNPQKNQYAYMMENFDETWINAGNKQEATYTNLNPGIYIFRVKASNNDGIWNEKGTSVKIIVNPPWWKSKIAYIIYILVIISLFVSIYKIRVNELEKQKKALARMVEDRTKELAAKNELLLSQAMNLKEANTLLIDRQNEIEEKNALLIQQTQELNETNTLLEERQVRIEEQSEELTSQKEELQAQRDHLFEMNSTKDKLFSIIGHDLRNPFNSILGFTELLIRKFRTYSPEVIEFQLGYINSATQNTLVLLNNLLEWSKTQRSIIHLEPQSTLFSNIVSIEFQLLAPQAKQKMIDLKNNILGTEYEVEIDQSTMSTVVRNLISNAIKFSTRQSEIIVTLDFTEVNKFTFSVKDTGVGMDNNKISTLFNVNTNTPTPGTNGEKGSGLGLLLCADFIQKHKGKIWVESIPNEGSTFFFTIPASIDQSDS